MNRTSRRQIQGGQVLRIHFDKGEIDIFVCTDELGVQHSVLAFCSGRKRSTAGGTVQRNPNPLCALDNVSVSDYVPVAIQNHAGANTVLARTESNIVGFSAVVDRTIGSDGD